MFFIEHAIVAQTSHGASQGLSLRVATFNTAMAAAIVVWLVLVSHLATRSTGMYPALAAPEESRGGRIGRRRGASKPGIAAHARAQHSCKS